MAMMGECEWVALYALHSFPDHANDSCHKFISSLINLLSKSVFFNKYLHLILIKLGNVSKYGHVYLI